VIPLAPDLASGLALLRADAPMGPMTAAQH